MARIDLAEILALPVDERVKLVQAIWDSLPEQPELHPPTDAVRQELDRRLEAYTREREALSGSPAAKSRVLSVEDVHRKVAELGLQTPAESATMVRDDRDAR